MSSRYLNEMLRLKCLGDIHALKVFPNVKEVTESFGAYNAVRTHLVDQIPEGFANPKVMVLAVGDGNTPRTGVTFAFRSRWCCMSVDPRMKKKFCWDYGSFGVKRCAADNTTIEKYCDTTRNYYRVIGSNIANADVYGILVSVHSHAQLRYGVETLYVAGVRNVAVVDIPCCFNYKLRISPNHTYKDSGILSPKNEVRVWNFRHPMEY